MIIEVLIILLIFVLFGLVRYRIKRLAAKVKGIKGENRIARKLRRLKRSKYSVINDILIQKGRYSNQIDHVVVSIYGIFVIETKNYSGWIHGSEKSEYWNQTLGKKKHPLRNPIKQNWSHVRALKSALSDFSYLRYYPIVVFTGSATLKNVYVDSPVIYDYQLLRTIRKTAQDPILTKDQVKSITRKLHSVNVSGRLSNKEHVRKVKSDAAERKRLEAAGLCPRCGDNLILRKGPYGKFYGCASFPKCRYKKEKDAN